MANKVFQMSDQAVFMIRELGGHMPGGFFIYKAEEPGELLYANKVNLAPSLTFYFNLVFTSRQDLSNSNPNHFHTATNYYIFHRQNLYNLVQLLFVNMSTDAEPS